MMIHSKVTKVLLYSSFAVLLVFYLSSYGCQPVVNYLAFYPDRQYIVEQDELPEGMTELTLTTEDGVRIYALYLQQPAFNKVLIYFHGNAGNIYHRIPTLQKLHSFGVNVIGVSYRGYGKSEGSPGEQGLYRDGEAVFQYLTQVRGFAQEDIIIMGRSIGSTVAINTAQHRNIDRLILVTPLTSGRAQAEAGGMGSIASLAGDAFNNIGKINNIRAPLLIIHGTRDRVIPFTMGQELYNQYHGTKQFVSINGAGHNNLQSRYAKPYWSAIGEFLLKPLSTAGK